MTTSQPPEGQHCAACLATGEPMTAQNGGGWACTDVPACTARILARIGQPVTVEQSRVLSGQPAQPVTCRQDDERAAYIDGLRHLADSLADHPELPLPYQGRMDAITFHFLACDLDGQLTGLKVSLTRFTDDRDEPAGSDA